MITLLAVPFILAAGSYLHGGDYLAKGYILGISSVLMSGICYTLAGLWGIPIGIIATMIYWFLFRTGRQADAELDFMYMADRININTIWVAYILPTAIVTAICIGILVFLKLYWLIAIPLLLIPTIYIPAWASKKYADYAQKGFSKELERTARGRVELYSALAPSSLYIMLLIFSLSKLSNYLT